MHELYNWKNEYKFTTDNQSNQVPFYCYTVFQFIFLKTGLPQNLLDESLMETDSGMGQPDSVDQIQEPSDSYRTSQVVEFMPTEQASTSLSSETTQGLVSEINISLRLLSFDYMKTFQNDGVTPEITHDSEAPVEPKINQSSKEIQNEENEIKSTEDLLGLRNSDEIKENSDHVKENFGKQGF